MPSIHLSLISEGLAQRRRSLPGRTYSAARLIVGKRVEGLATSLGSLCPERAYSAARLIVRKRVEVLAIFLKSLCPGRVDSVPRVHESEGSRGRGSTRPRVREAEFFISYFLLY